MFKVILEFTTKDKNIEQFLNDLDRSKLLNTCDNEEGMMINIKEFLEMRIEDTE